jgi:DNA invertase Pin-like site-specific DNA recombinase
MDGSKIISMRKDRQKAFYFRQKGYSYNQISQILNIPKSALSRWFRNIEISEKVKQFNISQAKKIWAQNLIKL